MCNDITWPGIKQLADVGEQLSLESLRVNGNKFGPQGSTADTGSPVPKFPAAFEHVATLGRRSPDELEEPSNRCLFPIYWLPNPDTAGKYLALLLACNSNLRHLDVAETDQTISSLVYFTAVLRHDQGTNETLQILDLSRPLGPHMHSFDSAHFAESLGQMLR
ncbi:unnamed protein product, partial [Timema podura]|nr:unnamed protein product [Timema podura]